jgi:hypothetical protein
MSGGAARDPSRTPRRAVLMLLLAAGLGLIAPPAVQADARRLTAAEIEQALSGNTIEGQWAGRSYKQYFAADGSTVYAEAGRPPSTGRWKADAGQDAYCSWWEMSGWACYRVLDGGPDTIIWVAPGSGERYPATVLPGKQL